MPTPPRVRIAPAPSGFLHVGSVRTALYNWLHARRHEGSFVFRIEDTDRTRVSEESVQSMTEAMRWVGLDWDEGPEVGGPYGPYRQSERMELFGAVARRLEEAGHLYRDERTSAELDAWREQRQKDGKPPLVTRDEVPGPTGDQPASLRLETPAEGEIVIDDVVRGEVSFDWKDIGDPVLVRSDGSPTYLLANAVDDVAQGISLICRGEDLLSSTPRQRLIHDLLAEGGLIDEALEEVELPARDDDWTIPQQYAHLSMIVGEDRKPLSKRHGSVSIQQFQRTGYLPDVLLNYLALLGWSPGDGRERLTVDELIEAFDLDAVGKTAAAFDVDKLTAFNGERIRDMDEDDLADRLVPFLDGTYPPEDQDWDALIDHPPTGEQRAIVEALVPITQERMQRLDEIQHYAPAFFNEEVELDPGAVRKVLGKDSAPAVLERSREVLADVDWNAEAIEGVLRPLSDELDVGFGKVAQPIRVAVTGTSVSPPLFESLEIMPRERVLKRIAEAVEVARVAAAGE